MCRFSRGKLTSGKLSSGKLSFWETALMGNCHSGKLLGDCLLGNWPFGKQSFWETSYWKNSSGKNPQRKKTLVNSLAAMVERRKGSAWAIKNSVRWKTDIFINLKYNIQSEYEKIEIVAAMVGQRKLSQMEDRNEKGCCREARRKWRCRQECPWTGHNSVGIVDVVKFLVVVVEEKIRSLLKRSRWRRKILILHVVGINSRLDESSVIIYSNSVLKHCALAHLTVRDWSDIGGNLISVAKEGAAAAGWAAPALRRCWACCPRPLRLPWPRLLCSTIARFGLDGKSLMEDTMTRLIQYTSLKSSGNKLCSGLKVF